jgi:Armadillo/beta-catenin-like repeat
MDMALFIPIFIIFHIILFSETNQEKIVEAGGLTSLLTLLRSSEDETIRRVAAGAIANLAMNRMLPFKLNVDHY